VEAEVEWKEEDVRRLEEEDNGWRRMMESGWFLMHFSGSKVAEKWWKLMEDGGGCGFSGTDLSGQNCDRC